MTPTSTDAQSPSATPSKKSLREALVAAERNAIAEALQNHAFNITHTARFLGVCRRTLQSKLQRLGLRPLEPFVQ